MDNYVETYPNPVNDKLFIRAGISDTYQVALFSQAGSLILETAFSGNTFILNTSEIPPGVYFLSISCTAGRIMRKIVK
jgi:hypothetical protein